ncbi:cytochrome d ubiquinol oxidase subunit II [Phytoactinopolyspora alkaliphila]|uniref:Cytochrome d ubiquinol oxidase subunit II n=1 Tax=Phytoactinopolyspora alkaliphila TaxID=1783498 RepID=A0A6N9YQN6_9ACTN|nr:cytochrome d ubiquinol oxidase subunit II [Phytoactinopolyspora alkaliphila]
MFHVSSRWRGRHALLDERRPRREHSRGVRAGAAAGNIAQGAPYGDRPALGTLMGPYSLLWGAAVVAVFATLGAVFSALRSPPERGNRAARTARRRSMPVLHAPAGRRRVESATRSAVFF